jgi:cysteine-rich repeat protein
MRLINGLVWFAILLLSSSCGSVILAPDAGSDVSCGDGIAEGTEECDDSGESAACDIDCTLALCGDGAVNTQAGEECDDAGESPSCNADCTRRSCGDGVLDTGEQCDDGNTNNGDGCDSACQREGFWAGGILRDVSPDTLVGWELCHQETYAGEQTYIADILEKCYKPNLLLACGDSSSETYALAAMGPRESVLFECGTQPDCVHNANAVGWYFSSEFSWGFAPEGEPVNRNTCDFGDQTASDSRLCWHTGGGVMQAGYRCGANIFLEDIRYIRAIYQSN